MSNDPAPLPYKRGGNLLLDSLTEAQRNRLLTGASEHVLEIRTVLFEPDEVVPYVYFPLSGLISLVTPMIDGDVVEMAVVGREGVVGVPWALDENGGATGRGVSQIHGTSIRVDADKFRQEIELEGGLAHYAAQYNRALFALVAQNAACNRLHTINERCARWLLMTYDRLGEDEFDLTHEFLSQMLGTRRASVTEAASNLQDFGALTYKRGTVRILDRDVLEKKSCECYEAIRHVYDKLYADTLLSN